MTKLKQKGLHIGGACPVKMKNFIMFAVLLQKCEESGSVSNSVIKVVKYERNG